MTSQISLSEAAARLRVHPFQLIAVLGRAGTEFTDVLPVIEEDLVETARVMLGDFKRDAVGPAETGEGRIVTPSIVHSDEITDDALSILNALERKGHWGTHTVAPDTIKRHFCHGIADYATTEKELLRRQLLTRHRGGAVSLNPKQKAQISQLISRSTDR